MLLRRGLAGLVAVLILAIGCAGASAAPTFNQYQFTFDELGNGLLSTFNTSTGALLTTQTVNGSATMGVNWDGAAIDAYTIALVYTLPVTVSTTGGWWYASGEDQSLPSTSPAQPATYNGGLTNFDPGDALHWGGPHTLHVLSGSALSEPAIGGQQWGGVPTASDAFPIGGGYVSTASGPEVNGIFTFTPTSTQSGFVSGGITYVFYSDGSFVPGASSAPEASSLAIWSMLGAIGLLFARRRFAI
jgi:hypothetical protein